MSHQRPLLFVCLAVLLSLSAGCTKSEAQLASEALARGLEAHRAGSVDEAERNYRTSLEHDPANVLAFYNLGVLDHEAGRPFEAENHYRLALSHDPEYPPALFNLALLRQGADSNAEAVDIWRRYMAVRQGDAAAHLHLSDALRALGRIEEADQELATARLLDPSIVPATPDVTPDGETPAPS